jgi:hypothetical protein
MQQPMRSMPCLVVGSVFWLLIMFCITNVNYEAKLSMQNLMVRWSRWRIRFLVWFPRNDFNWITSVKHDMPPRITPVLSGWHEVVFFFFFGGGLLEILSSCHTPPPCSFCFWQMWYALASGQLGEMNEAWVKLSMYSESSALCSTSDPRKRAFKSISVTKVDFSTRFGNEKLHLFSRNFDHFFRSSPRPW